MNQVAKKQAGTVALPADFSKKLAAGIAQSHRDMRKGSGGGKPFLRLLKSGEWVYGADDVEVQEGSNWGVNVATLQHGYCCWIESKLEDEIMVSMLDHKPDCPPPLHGTDYAEQFSFELKCLDGEDAGQEVLYKTTSHGGCKAVRLLTDEIMKRAAAENPCIFPAMQLEMDHYPHKRHGKTFVPIFNITSWVDINGNTEGAEAEAIEAPEPEEEAAPTRGRTRRAPVKAAKVEEPKPEPPVSTTQARAGQRRRPGK